MYYLISYDLALPGQDYPAIIGAIQGLGGVRVLWSTWAVFSTRSAHDIWADLVRYLDTNDRLLVTGIDGWQGSNLMALPAAA